MDAHRCEKCRSQSRATKALRISRCPPVLVLHLKRFSLADPADYLSPLQKVRSQPLVLVLVHLSMQLHLKALRLADPAEVARSLTGCDGAGHAGVMLFLLYEAQDHLQKVLSD